ncbi:MAG: U32 family peptidase [Candidatus Paceibacterota bacterium]|jgi:putative protease
MTAQNKKEDNGKAIELELLAPAKDIVTAEVAILAGADAVYIGGPQFGARSAAGNTWEDIESLVKFAHKYYVKIYLPINTIFYDEERAAVEEMIKKAYDIGVDAIIVQDMGIMEMDLPPIPIFASTQAHNYEPEQVEFFDKAGFQRVILARECSLEQIKKIREKTKVDLEVFVHGAICVSFSGRCYLSQAMCQRSANRGKCIQACRLPYSLVDSEGTEIVKDKFLLSLKDFNLSASLGELIEAGITSFKIEGRLKSEIYVGNVVAKYRQELDKIIASSKGKYKRPSSGATRLDFEPDLDRTFNRGYTTHFIYGRQKDCVSVDSQKSLGKFVGKVKEKGDGYFTLDRENDLKNADGLCWFDERNDLIGTNINLVERAASAEASAGDPSFVPQACGTTAGEAKIYPNKWLSLKPGMDIYRNLDIAFGKKVVNGAERRVAVDFVIKETQKGFSVSAKDEDGNTMEMEFAAEKKPAQKPELVEDSWKKQFSRLGDTIFCSRDFSFETSKPYFIPMSVLNDWRRILVSELLKVRAQNYPKVFAKHQKTDYPYPYKELDYSFNVSNALSRAFYERHGAKVSEASFEQQKDVRGKKLMTTRHCLRYFLGACPKNLEEGRPQFKEPLFLTYNGKKFRLGFDCARCVMEVWNEE